VVEKSIYIPAATCDRGCVSVAKPIELELKLTGEDAREFHEYMNSHNQRMTPEGRQITREAIELSKKLRLI